MYSRFLLILFWRGELCPANHGSPTSSPSRFYLTSSYRNGSALEKRVINHFEVTVIYHFKRIVLAPAFGSLWLSYSASCSLSFTNANDNLQRAEWLYYAGANPHFEEIIICHIEKRVWGAIFNWEQRLVIGFIRDFERIIISDLPSVSPCIQEVQKALTLCALCWRCAECRWSGSGTKDLISGDFHSAKQRLNPENNSLREIPIKGGRSHCRLSNFI